MTARMLVPALPRPIRLMDDPANLNSEPAVITARRAINEKHARLAAALGTPICEMAASGEGYIRPYQHGLIAWTRQHGAHAVYGAIADKYVALGGAAGILGWPLADRSATPDGVGCYNAFQGGAIYWSPDTGAHELHGPVWKKWGVFGWEQSPLGYPISDVLADGVDLVASFQHGQIHWSADRGAVVIPDSVTLDWNCGHISVSRGAKLAGSGELTLERTGDFMFSGQVHYIDDRPGEFTITAIAITEAGIGYTLIYGGRAETEEQSSNPLSLRHEWSRTGNCRVLRHSWRRVAQADLYVCLTPGDNSEGAMAETAQAAMDSLAKQGLATNLKALVRLL